MSHDHSVTQRLSDLVKGEDSFGGRVDVYCPHCEALLNVEVGNAADKIWYECPDCGQNFFVDWAF